MDGFIKLSNFAKIVPYMQLFRDGLLVTVLLSLFTVVIGFYFGTQTEKNRKNEEVS